MSPNYLLHPWPFTTLIITLTCATLLVNCNVCLISFSDTILPPLQSLKKRVELNLIQINKIQFDPRKLVLVIKRRNLFTKDQDLTSMIFLLCKKLRLINLKLNNKCYKKTKPWIIWYSHCRYNHYIIRYIYSTISGKVLQL